MGDITAKIDLEEALGVVYHRLRDLDGKGYPAKDFAPLMELLAQMEYQASQGEIK